MRSRLFQFLIIFVFGGIAGFFLAPLLQRPAVRSTQVRDQGNFQFINPILLCSASDGDQSASLAGIRSRVVAVVNQDRGLGLAQTIGVYYSELNSSQWFGVNENEKFTPGSLLKLPVLIAYFKKAETDPAVLTKSYLYSGTTDEDALQNFKPTAGIQAGKRYTALELLHAMITQSDNNAAQLLLQHVDVDILDKTYEMLKFSPPTSPLAINFISPKTYSYFLRVLYNASYLTREFSEQALAMLSENNFAYGLRSGVPAEVKISDKFGERILQDQTPAVNELHDCGVVYYPEHPYVLCVMTRGAKLANLPAAIKDVSAAVYTSVDAQYR